MVSTAPNPNKESDFNQLLSESEKTEVENDEFDIIHHSERFRSTKNVRSPGRASTKKKLTWVGVEADIMSKESGMKPILKGVSGEAYPGEVTFIMGSSGAGKTTLLNILTERNTKNLSTRGTVVVNNRQLDIGDMNKISAYVQQDDVFAQFLTVHETLHFAAKLRAPQKLTKVERDDIVEELLITMNLKKCEYTEVGSLTKKSLSRGEKKRLAFACEILTDPPIFFCDEPTSGLDSFMAHQVIKCLRKLAQDEGKTIVCTIHQPSTNVYAMADRLVLLCEGLVAYQGSPMEIADYLNEVGHPLPQFSSLPDHFMRIISKSPMENDQSYKERIDSLIQTFSSSYEEPSTVILSQRSLEDSKRTPYPRSWCQQFTYLTHRSFLQFYRDNRIVVYKLLQVLLLAFFAGAIFFQISLTVESIDTYKGISFLSTQMMNMLFFMPAMTLLWQEFPVVVREYQSNMYSPTAYILAKTTVDTFQYVLFPFTFGSILYGLAGLPLDIKIMGVYFSTMVLTGTVVASAGHMFAALAGDLTTAVSFGALFAAIMHTFGGFYIHLDDIPIYFWPLPYVSWFRWGYSSLLINFFEGVDVIPGCESTNGTCITGEEVIQSATFEKYELNVGYIVLVVAIVLFKIVSVITFYWRVKKAN